MVMNVKIVLYPEFARRAQDGRVKRGIANRISQKSAKYTENFPSHWKNGEFSILGGAHSSTFSASAVPG